MNFNGAVIAIPHQSKPYRVWVADLPIHTDGDNLFEGDHDLRQVLDCVCFDDFCKVRDQYNFSSRNYQHRWSEINQLLDEIAEDNGWSYDQEAE